MKWAQQNYVWDNHQKSSYKSSLSGGLHFLLGEHLPPFSALSWGKACLQQCLTQNILSDDAGCSPLLLSSTKLLLVASSEGANVRTTGISLNFASFVSHIITPKFCNWSKWWCHLYCIRQRTCLCTNNCQKPCTWFPITTYRHWPTCSWQGTLIPLTMISDM